MKRLPPPATGVELYLEAILEELRALRVALVDGLPGLAASKAGQQCYECPLVEGFPVCDPASPRCQGSPAPLPADPTPPTKRTRTRTRPGG